MMNEQQMLDGQVRQWQAEGRWVDDGEWVRLRWSRYPAYMPTRREIAAKCRLFRSLDGWRGAKKRAPRDGEFAVSTTAGV
jgi:hypothetical protein